MSEEVADGAVRRRRNPHITPTKPPEELIMSTNSPDIAVALYDQHTRAENAVKTLQRAGFDMKKISIDWQGL